MPKVAIAKNTEVFHYPGRLLSRAQVQKILGVGRTTFYRMLANRKDPIPRVKLPGTSAKYPEDKLFGWIDNHLQ